MTCAKRASTADFSPISSISDEPEIGRHGSSLVETCPGAHFGRMMWLAAANDSFVYAAAVSNITAQDAPVIYGSDSVMFTVEPDKALVNCVAGVPPLSMFMVSASGDQLIFKVTEAICLSGNQITSGEENGRYPTMHRQRYRLCTRLSQPPSQQPRLLNRQHRFAQPLQYQSREGECHPPQTRHRGPGCQ